MPLARPLLGTRAPQVKTGLLNSVPNVRTMGDIALRELLTGQILTISVRALKSGGIGFVTASCCGVAQALLPLAFTREVNGYRRRDQHLRMRLLLRRSGERCPGAEMPASMVPRSSVSSCSALGCFVQYSRSW